MRPEWRFGLAAALALSAGAFCAEPYARLAAPCYAAVDRLVAGLHPWSITEVAVTPDPQSQGVVLRLMGEVRRRRADLQPAALVVTRLQVGEAIQTPLVFWTLLLMWPAATHRERWTRLGVGVATFLGLEIITTAAQLLHPMAEASALLSGQLDLLTPWERWSEFLEAGGNFVVAATAALAAVAAAHAIGSRLRPN